MIAPRFSLLHTRNLRSYKATKLQRKHLRSKRIPLPPNPEQTHSRELLGKTSETASSEQTCVYGFMAASQSQAHLGWRRGGGWEDHAPVTFLPFLLRYGLNKSQGWGQNSQPIKWFMGPAAHSPRTMYFITVNLRTRYNFLSQGAAFKSGHLDSPATTYRNNRSQPHRCLSLLACAARNTKYHL